MVAMTRIPFQMTELDRMAAIACHEQRLHVAYFTHQWREDRGVHVSM